LKNEFEDVKRQKVSQLFLWKNNTPLSCQMGCAFSQILSREVVRILCWTEFYFTATKCCCFYFMRIAASKTFSFILFFFTFQKLPLDRKFHSCTGCPPLKHSTFWHSLQILNQSSNLETLKLWGFKESISFWIQIHMHFKPTSEDVHRWLFLCFVLIQGLVLICFWETQHCCKTRV